MSEYDEPLAPDWIRDCDPGIRQVVAWLRTLGWPTCDSGDGVSKPGGPEVMPFPHVVIASCASDLIEDSKRLVRDLNVRGVPVGLERSDGQGYEVGVEATYFPNGDIAIIMITGLNDELLGKCTIPGDDDEWITRR